MMPRVDFSRYDNSFYDPGASVIKRTLWYFVNVLFFINPLMPVNFIKTALLRMFGAELGPCVVIKPGVNIKYPWFLQTGHHVWIGENVWIDNLARVKIGSNVCISQGACLCTGNHDFRSDDFMLTVKEIVIEDGAWIGAKAVVVPGIRCGKESVLAVNSVATSDLAPGWVYQGNPARRKTLRFPGASP